MNSDQKAFGLSLLKSAQGGDKLAEFDLLELIRIHLMPKRIGRYLNKNRQVDNDDVKQEFMIGVSLAIQDARLDIGDPLEYLATNGLYRVKSYMRKFIVQGTMQVCNDCGAKSRINRIGNQYHCKKCGGTNVSTVEVEDHNETLFETMQVKGFENDVLSDMMVTDFKSTLTPGTNLYDLYELLIEKGIDRDNPLIKNYMKTIADMWGGCSTQNVSLNLKKLRVKLEKYLEENSEMVMMDKLGMVHQ